MRENFLCNGDTRQTMKSPSPNVGECTRMYILLTHVTHELLTGHKITVPPVEGEETR